MSGRGPARDEMEVNDFAQQPGQLYHLDGVDEVFRGRRAEVGERALVSVIMQIGNGQRLDVTVLIPYSHGKA